ncbi:diguanylate cyclase [Pseudofrankia inefficax]|uniref:Diguanylate cyclase n=2 Tax=Pseudofrankia inefficax (strain DSM 45817 / CECT 9037 / DDB 130130 / EuI1c) TaxID=298654 RepID=E3J916_PSEI1|nr:diguanylate cyclase [Pseudofrankia inefficax]
MVVGLRMAGGAVPGRRRSAGSPWGPWLYWRAAVGATLLVGLATALAVLLEPEPAKIAMTILNFVAEVAAAVACFGSTRRAAAGDRRWRVLIGTFAAALAGATLATVVSLLKGDSATSLAPPESLTLVAFYGLALAGLLCLPTRPIDGRATRERVGPSRWHAIIVLDSALIVGSVFLLEWGTSLEAVVRARAPALGLLLLALVQQVTALILVATVLMIATFRRPRSPTTLTLLGSGLLAFALMGSIFVYRTAHGSYDISAWALFPCVVSMLLITLAALAPSIPAGPDDRTVPGSRAMWMHAALPYAALTVIGLLILIKLAAGGPLDRVQAYGAVSLLVLALVRQMITMAENTQLLAEIREREGQLRYQAFHDPLTGLANRALFSRRLRQAMAAVPGPGRDSAAVDRQVAVLFVDLDHFKRVNDAFGHAAGDELLKISAARLRAGTRTTDTVARLGGDEFAVILDSAGPDRPVRVAERLTAALQAPCELAGQTYVPHASLGVVALDPTARQTSPDALLHQADLAMYAAKREHAGSLVVYQPGL